MRTLAYALALLLAAFLGGTKAWVEYRVAQSLLDWQAKAAPYAALSHRAVALSLAGDLHVRGVQAALPSAWALSAETLRLRRAYAFYPPDRLPLRIEIDLAGIVLELSETAEDWLPLAQSAGYGEYHLGFKELAALGLTRLKGQARLRLEQGTRGEIVLDLPGVAEVSIQAEFSAPLPRNLAELRLDTLAVNYTDQGGLARIFTYLGKRRQIAPETLRASFAVQVENDLRRLGLGDALSAGLGRLLRHGEPLNLALPAGEPVTPAQAVERLWRL